MGWIKEYWLKILLAVITVIFTGIFSMLVAIYLYITSLPARDFMNRLPVVVDENKKEHEEIMEDIKAYKAEIDKSFESKQRQISEIRGELFQHVNK